MSNKSICLTKLLSSAFISVRCLGSWLLCLWDGYIETCFQWSRHELVDVQNITWQGKRKLFVLLVRIPFAANELSRVATKIVTCYIICWRICAISSELIPFVDTELVHFNGNRDESWRIFSDWLTESDNNIVECLVGVVMFLCSATFVLFTLSSVV